MPWWNEWDKRYPLWKEGGVPCDEGRDSVIECCYANCIRNHNLYSVILFDSLIILAVMAIGLEEDWPSSYLR